MTPAAAETASLADPAVVPPGARPGAADGRAAGSADDHDPDGDSAGGGPPDGGGVPAIVRRRLAPFQPTRRDYLWSWAATAVVTLIAGLLRLRNVDHPKGKIFDELYYATEGWALLQHGVEWNEKDNAASYVVHPPLGKWAIALGEQIYGYNEFGWRISAVVAGTLSVLLLVRIARLMFHSTVLGCAAGLLMALDGFHLVLSRAALLDIFLGLFLLAAFGALVVDREARRRRWLRALEGGLDPTRPGRAGRLPFAVPWRRLLAAVLLGCALGVKWSAVFFFPAYLLLVLFWDAGARRSAGVPRPWRETWRAEYGWLFAYGVLLTATYLASWTGWFVTDDGYFRNWLADSGQEQRPILGDLQNLFHYHQEALKFHTGLGSYHKYQSWPWQWLLLGRPVAFYYSSDGPCGGGACASEVLLLGTPVLWWSFLPALAALAWLGIARRDWRAGAIWMGVAAGLVPWFYYALEGRTMFSFYVLPALPFLIMAVVYALGAMMSPPPGHPADEGRRTTGAIIAGGYVLFVAVCFAWYYPIFIGQPIPYADWNARMLLGGRWI